MSFNTIANAAALAVIAVLAIIYWHCRRHQSTRRPESRKPTPGEHRDGPEARHSIQMEAQR